MSCFVFFWQGGGVIHWCLKFMCRRFGIFHKFHLHRWRKQVLPVYTTYKDGTDGMFRNVGI